MAVARGVPLTEMLDIGGLLQLRDLKLLNPVLVFLAVYVGPVAVFRAYDHMLEASLENFEVPECNADFGVFFGRLLVSMLIASPTRGVVLDYLGEQRPGTALSLAVTGMFAIPAAPNGERLAPWQFAVRSVLTNIAGFAPILTSFPKSIRRSVLSPEALMLADFARSDDKRGLHSSTAWIIVELHRASPSLVVKELLRVSVTSLRSAWRTLPRGALDGLRSPSWLLVAACVILDRYRARIVVRNEALAELFKAAESTARSQEFRAMMNNEVFVN
ncbi:hypothetical protein H9P43_009242 [Blastocladiella emersonii ATCC 22665]|nr:hypothetical protein H9P43_009242 [Blastocladiella emersonii ATCC 22665]